MSMPSLPRFDRTFIGRHAVAGLVIAAALVCGTVVAAQLQSLEGLAPEPKIQNIPYDGKFTFARIRYMTGPGGYYYRGLPAWAHGFPTAERNLMGILNEISYIAPHVEEDNVFTLDDPQLFKFPVAYMTEAGYWTITPRQAANFRAYLLKGGFVIFDDFRGGFRGGGGWENFEANMRRVLPELRFIDMDTSQPIFHSFFEIDSFDIVSQFYDQGRPVFKGLFEDNDPHKRMLAMVNFNTDVSNFWEFSGTGYRPVADSNEAYQLGINYVIYGLTH
jgi:hypothetical protein